MSDSALSAFFLLQVACILLVCRGVGLAARYIGQPQVVAEMLAGFLLGPSFFGWMMTLTTTLMAYPLFGLVWRHAPARAIDGRAFPEASS